MKINYEELSGLEDYRQKIGKLAKNVSLIKHVIMRKRAFCIAILESRHLLPIVWDSSAYINLKASDINKSNYHFHIKTSKYEEVRADIPALEIICRIFNIICRENFQESPTFTNQEVIKMEAQVLVFLKFELSIPTTRNFLQILLPVIIDHHVLLNPEIFAKSKTFRCLVEYLAELSILDYWLHYYYPSSIVAASAIFLAKFILEPSQNPWDSFLVNLTGYEASQLMMSVFALHRMFLMDKKGILPSAIKEKYEREKDRFIGNSSCIIPKSYFESI